jgi:hypothetical protein
MKFYLNTADGSLHVIENGRDWEIIRRDPLSLSFAWRPREDQAPWPSDQARLSAEDFVARLLSMAAASERAQREWQRPERLDLSLEYQARDGRKVTGLQFAPNEKAAKETRIELVGWLQKGDSFRLHSWKADGTSVDKFFPDSESLAELVPVERAEPDVSRMHPSDPRRVRIHNLSRLPAEVGLVPNREADAPKLLRYAADTLLTAADLEEKP